MLTNSIDPFIQDFLTHLRFEKKYSNHTLMAYQNDLEAFAKYLQKQYEIKDIQYIRPLHIRSWFSEMIAEEGIQPASIKRKKSSLQSLFKFLIQEGHIKNNPAAVVPTPKLPKRLPKTIEPEAIEKIIALDDYIDNDDSWQSKNEKLIIKLLFETGIRRAEICSIQEKDVHISRKTLLIFGKGGKERTVPLHSTTLQLIEYYIQEKKKLFDLQNNSSLFITPTGKDIYEQYVYRLVKRFLDKVSSAQKKSPHVLRHTFATALLNNGADISAIKDLLGHASLAATQVYTHTNIENLQKEFRKSHPRS